MTMKHRLNRFPWDVKSVLVLFLLTLYLIGSRALINILGPLQWCIIDSLKISTYEYGVLVSLCCWASLFDVFHGYFLDRFLGLVAATWIYNILICIGCIVLSIAGFSKAYWLMVLGRTILGLGLNPLILLGYKHAIHWFGAGNYVNTVYSYCESISWFGSSITYLITGPIMDSFSRNFNADQSFAITFASESIAFMVITTAPMLIAAYIYKFKKSDLKEANAAYKKDKEEKPISDQKNLEITDKLTFIDYVRLPAVFWLFAITAFLYYVNSLSFLSMSVVYFKSEHGLKTNEASTISGMISLLPCVISPFSGWMLDRIGHNLTAFTLAILLNTLSLSLLKWTSLHPIIPAIIMGLSLTASTGLWSQFQFLVKSHQYMIAYGVAQTGLNGAQAVGTMIAGFIVDHHGYSGFIIFQFCMIICAVPVISLVWLLDLRRNNFLNKTSKQKNIILGRLAEQM